MSNYKSKRTDEAVERIKMMIDEESSAELAESGMCERTIRCLQSYKDLAGIDDDEALAFKRCATNRVESIVKICTSTSVLREHGVDDMAVTQVVDTLLKDIDAYADLDVYQVMDMYFEACTENVAAKYKRKEKEMRRPKRNTGRRIITIYAGESGSGKSTLARRELESYLRDGRDAVLYDDMPADTDYNEIVKNDKHEVILITTCC